MVIKKIPQEDMKKAIELVWRVFIEFEAPDYTEEGIKEFRKTILDEKWVKERVFFGAYEEELLGVIATKDGTHIALLFVEGKHHKKGIGKKLFQTVKELNTSHFFTVNSSPYAHEVYKHLGFVDTTKEEQVVNGLRFYPMRMEF